MYHPFPVSHGECKLGFFSDCVRIFLHFRDNELRSVVAWRKCVPRDFLQFKNRTDRPAFENRAFFVLAAHLVCFDERIDTTARCFLLFFLRSYLHFYSKIGNDFVLFFISFISCAINHLEYRFGNWILIESDVFKLSFYFVVRVDECHTDLLLHIKFFHLICIYSNVIDYFFIKLMSSNNRKQIKNISINQKYW